MLVSLTPNASLDRTLLAGGFRTAEVCRAAAVHEAASGKGMNVVRVAMALGVPVRALAPLAGTTGQRFADLAAAAGIDGRWCWLAAGETRISTIVIDPATADTLVVNENGPRLARDDWQALAALIRSEAGAARLFTTSGSLPPGLPVEAFGGLMAELEAAGLPVCIDTSSATLAAALDWPVTLLKVNAEELGEAIGQSILSQDAALAAAHAVLQRGPRAVIVTLGKQGAVAVAPAGAWFARPPEVAAISPVGSGDALLAGVAAALLDGRDWPEALRLGTACGAANTLTVGSGIVRPEDAAALQARVEVEVLGNR
jgi:1-phosphofructokinase